MKRTKKLQPREKEIQSVLLEYLALVGIKAWRQNSGAFKSESGHFYRFSSIKGQSDIIGLLPSGKFLAVEVKRPGKLPSPDQINFINMVRGSQGVAIVAHSLEELMFELKPYLNG